MVKCSVVVPVWNPGPSIVRCVDSLLGQSMAAADYEIVFVDDGSTDGTADHLDALEKAHPGLIRVLHTPPSGWPGRPRNIGVDAAHGEYVQFVDNDDTLPPYALEAMYDSAVDTDADIVLGRPASNFRGINHALYQRGLAGVTLAQAPDLVESTTPHKMLRRSFLLRHGIRFPEGVPHEDQVFMMQAYARAASITMLVDRCYYFYLRRLGSGRNAGDQRVAPAAHFDAVEKILDILDKDIGDPDLRDRLARRFYRVELMNLLWSAGIRTADPESQRELFDAVSRVATTRFAPGVRAGCGAAHRSMGYLVEHGDGAGALAFGQHCAAIGLRTAAVDVRWRDGALEVDIDAQVCDGDEPLRCAAAAGGWALPAAFAPSVPEADRLLDAGRDEPDAELMLVSRIDSRTFGLGEGMRVAIDGTGIIRVTGTARIDPATALAGAPLSDGLWDVRLRLWFAGISRTPAVLIDPSVAARLALSVGADGRSVRPFASADHLALDVGGWASSLPSALAPGTELGVIAPRELRLSVPADIDGTAALDLVLTPAAGVPGVPVTRRVELAGRAPAHATVLLPADLAEGAWHAWLRPAEPSASPPAALPWLVDRSPHGLEARRVAAPEAARPVATEGATGTG